MQGIVYEHSLRVFLFATVLLGGGAAWLTGRALAGTWRPLWQMAVYALLLGAVVRFLHHAVFGGTFLSARFFVVDTLVCLAFGLAAFRLTRLRQMRMQYGWLTKPETE